MFGTEEAPWDQEKKYKPENLLIYFERTDLNELVEVPMSYTLSEILCDKR